MQHLVLEGDLYRLESPFESNYFAFAIVSKDKSKAHLTCYRSLNHCNPHNYRIVMKGLDENKLYYIPERDLTVHGSTLMNVGLVISFEKSDFASVTLTFEEK
jgi:alpha-galactosidase